MKNATRSGPARTPRFFWQGALIILPVAVLAVVSLTSLHNDERTAEQDARAKAAENVQSLARTMRVTVNNDLAQYAGFQELWIRTTRTFSRPRPGGYLIDDQFSVEQARWEQAHPGIRFVEQASPAAVVLVEGRQVIPPEIPEVPVPPKWFGDLSPEQAALWRILRETVATMDKQNVTNKLEAFLRYKPSAEAQQAAAFLTSEPKDAFNTTNNLSTESGITFQDLAAYQLLRSTNELSKDILDHVWRQIFVTPTFTAPDLLWLLEAQTNRVDSAGREKIMHMGELWESESRTRDWLNTLRRVPALEATNGLLWVKSDAGGEALAVFETITNASDAEGNEVSGQGHRIEFLSRAVIESVFDRAFRENKFLVPNYVTMVLTVEGAEFFKLEKPTVQKDLLSEATGKLTVLTQDTPDINFEIKFFLTGRKQMLAAEYRRAKLFGALILGTALTALVGLFAAWRAFHRQRQLNEMKSNFVSSVSHELRAPIASVRLMAENLESGKVAELPKQREYFGFIVQECRRLTSLIENILDFSRIEQGRKQYEFEPTDIVKLVEQTVKLMETAAGEKGVVLKSGKRKAESGNAGQPRMDTNEHESEEGEDREEHPTPNIQQPTSNGGIELNVDGRAIQQALVNLIDNAIKHSVRGGMVRVGIERKGEVGKSGKRKAESGNGGQPRIDTNKHESEEHPTPNIQHRTSNETVCLFVEDDGRGIAEGEREKIFERFYRSGSELRRETQGVGIGLSIVKHIVEAHGGVVRVESEVGVGSRFTIELPG